MLEKNYHSTPSIPNSSMICLWYFPNHAPCGNTIYTSPLKALRVSVFFWCPMALIPTEIREKFKGSLDVSGSFRLVVLFIINYYVLISCQNYMQLYGCLVVHPYLCLLNPRYQLSGDIPFCAMVKTGAYMCPYRGMIINPFSSGFISI